jgi:hypothetical protein
LITRWALQQSWIAFVAGLGFLFAKMRLPHAFTPASSATIRIPAIPLQVVPFPEIYLPWGLLGFTAILLPFFVIAAFAYWSPQRSIADWICGTRMVRR